MVGGCILSNEEFLFERDHGGGNVCLHNFYRLVFL